MPDRPVSYLYFDTGMACDENIGSQINVIAAGNFVTAGALQFVVDASPGVDVLLLQPTVVQGGKVRGMHVIAKRALLPCTKALRCVKDEAHLIRPLTLAHVASA